MPCPTCDHAMKHIGHNRSHSVYWCPGCGTIKDDNPHSDDAVREAAAPKLVSQCREYASHFCKENIAQYYRNTWNRLGIAESINLPADRSANTLEQAQ